MHFINKDTVNDLVLDDSTVTKIYDIQLILSYISDSTDINLLEDILHNVGYSINSTPLYKKYLSLLHRSEVDKIRNVYLQMIHIPLHNLQEVFSEFEEFELETNKVNGKKVVSECFVIYQNTLQFYNQIKNKYYNLEYREILKSEMERGSSPDRINFIFKYLLYYLYDNEEIYFLYSEYLNNEEGREIVEMGIRNISSVFLRIYYLYKYTTNSVYSLSSNVYSLSNNVNSISNNVNSNIKKVYKFNDIPNIKEIEIMNHLNLILKHEGINSFRREFIKLKINNLLNDIMYKNICDVEYNYTNINKTNINNDILINIYKSGIEDTNSDYLKSSLINFLLEKGDINNSLLYSKMYNIGYNKILEYEFKYGNNYFDLLNSKEEYNRNEEYNKYQILKNEEYSRNEKYSRNEEYNKYQILKNNMSYGMNMDLREDVKEFIKKINYIKKKDDILIKYDMDKLIEILTSIE